MQSINLIVFLCIYAYVYNRFEIVKATVDSLCILYTRSAIVLELYLLVLDVGGFFKVNSNTVTRKMHTRSKIMHWYVVFNLIIA